MAKQKDASTREAAKLLGISLQAVYALIWAGKLPATQVEGKWCVEQAAIDERVSRKVERA